MTKAHRIAIAFSALLVAFAIFSGIQAGVDVDRRGHDNSLLICRPNWRTDKTGTPRTDVAPAPGCRNDAEPTSTAHPWAWTIASVSSGLVGLVGLVATTRRSRQGRHIRE